MLTNDDVPPRAPGHRAAHEQSRFSSARTATTSQVLRGHALGAHAAGHALALEDAARVRAVADRAAVPEVLVRAVRRRESR